MNLHTVTVGYFQTDSIIVSELFLAYLRILQISSREHTNILDVQNGSYPVIVNVIETDVI